MLYIYIHTTYMLIDMMGNMMNKENYEKKYGRKEH